MKLLAFLFLPILLIAQPPTADSINLNQIKPSGGTAGQAMILSGSPLGWHPATLPSAVSILYRQVTNAPSLAVADFNFTPQTPGGNLIIGSNAVTLIPVPLGVNGADASHSLYVSGGTGTAEACLITGGAGTSGQPTGSVNITCAHTHSGAWTIASDSGGLRETIIQAAAGQTIVLPPNTTLPTMAGVIIDKNNLDITAQGRSSVLQARAGAALNTVLWATACNYCRLSNFSIDGNRSSNGTNPTFGTGLTLGTDGVGGFNHGIAQALQVSGSAFFGIFLNDTNNDVEISGNYVHDNGGVTDATGNGIGIFAFYHLTSGHAYSTDVRILRNWVEHNHNTITTAGNSGCIFTIAVDVTASYNYCKDNYNQGGQLANIDHSGPGVFSHNTITQVDSTALTESTSGIESDGVGWTYSDNIIYNTTGIGIALEGNPAGPGGLGAGNSNITGNYIGQAAYGIYLLNAGGITRGITITGNRIAANSGPALVIDTAAVRIVATGNEFTDSTSPVVIDNSTYGALLSGNSPMSANLGYGGSMAATTNILNARCNSVETVTGSSAVQFIVQLTNTALNGSGCTVTLIPALSSTWTLATGGNIGKAYLPVAGTPVVLVWDGTSFWPTGGASVGGGWVPPVAATFSAAATTGTLAHAFGSASHVVNCVNGGNFPVSPSSVVLGSSSDTFSFAGGLSSSTTCIASR